MKRAEDFCKLVLAVRTRCLLAKNNPDRPTLTQEEAASPELELTREEEEQASVALENSAAYVVAVELDAVLDETFPDRFNHPDTEIRVACQLARILRDSFDTNPFQPTWKFPPEWAWRKLGIKDVISLDGKALNRRPVRRRDYGGLLSLLRLLEFVRLAVEYRG